MRKLRRKIQQAQLKVILKEEKAYYKKLYPKRKKDV